ncbi:hypothetical protein CTI14_50640, partial [Methylobacterium radiotolerans]
MARMQQRLDAAVRTIVHSTASIAAASRQIAAGTLVLLALVLAGGAALFSARISCGRSMRRWAVCERVANGDLSSAISHHHRGEIGRLFGAMARMQQRLDAAVRTIVHSTASIAAASRQIAAG